MAVDEVLLDSAAEQGLATLRFYQWSEPTLSLGYFQHYAARQSHGASRGCPAVRRQTGGGAILHDNELTYSLALPCASPLAADAVRLYQAVHEALRACLAQSKVEVTVCAASESVATPAFLCFQRRAVGDVLLDTAKVCGSAQAQATRRDLATWIGAAARSKCAPELPGIFDLTAKRIEAETLAVAWSEAISRQLQLSPTAGRLSELEVALARDLALEKYGTARWNERR